MKRIGGLAAAALLVVSASWAGCSSDASSEAPPAADDGGDDAAAPDAGSDAPDFGAPSTTYPAFMPSVPQMANAGGVVLHDFTVVPVVYAGDTVGAKVSDFLAKYAASATFAAQAADYAMGTMTVAPIVTLPDTAPAMISRDEIRAYLRDRLDGTHPEWGGNDGATIAKTVYVLVYPSGTTLTKPGESSCGSFQGFHDVAAFVAGADAGTTTLATDATPIYAAIPRCAQPGLSDVDALMQSVSHEVLEAATDPFQPPKAGYLGLDPDHTVWAGGMHGSEIADLCDLLEFFYTPPDVGYSTARVWSSSAARAYHDPCVPAPPGPYFNTAIPTTDVAIDATHATKGISLTVGKPQTFDVLFFSDAATQGPWTIAAKEWQISAKDPLVLDVKLDRMTGTNGEKAHVTVTANKTTPVGFTSILVVSQLGKRVSVWFTFVGVQ